MKEKTESLLQVIKLQQSLLNRNKQKQTKLQLAHFTPVSENTYKLQLYLYKI